MGLLGPIGRKGLLGSVIWNLEVLTSWWGNKKALGTHAESLGICWKCLCAIIC